jgi:hypothetical protein
MMLLYCSGTRRPIYKRYDWSSRRTGGGKAPLSAQFYDALTVLLPPEEAAV